MFKKVICFFANHAVEYHEEAPIYTHFVCKRCGEAHRWQSDFNSIRDLFDSDLFQVIKVIAITLLFLGAVISMPLLAYSKACQRVGVTMQLETKYDLWAGCFVNLSSYGWVPFDSLATLMKESE